MNTLKRIHILNELKDGEQKGFHKASLIWNLGKGLSYGITKDGFPFIVWETQDFASIQVGMSRWGEEPVSKLRNDASANIVLNTQSERMHIAERMSKQLVY